jgi:AICAR transformylase/IMP cyclohydrolase PurH
VQGVNYYYMYNSDGVIQSVMTGTDKNPPTAVTGYFILKSAKKLDTVGLSVNPKTKKFVVKTLKPTEKDIRKEFTKSRDNKLYNSTVEYDGMIFDSGELSQSRMLRPIAVLQNDTDTHSWVLHDNSVVQLTKPQFIAVLDLAVAQQTAMWIQP